MSKPTPASVTELPCKCGCLARYAECEYSAIQFDTKTAEYQMHKDGGYAVIYHCPFCGGAAPKSQRANLFATIPPTEELWLSEILAPVQTINDAIELLGDPDLDSWSKTIRPESDDKPPVIAHHRTIRYTEPSDVADVHIQETSTGRAFWQLVGKYVGPKGEQTKP